MSEAQICKIKRIQTKKATLIAQGIELAIDCTGLALFFASFA